MELIWNDGVEDAIVEIASSGSLQARREVAKIVSFLQVLEDYDQENVRSAGDKLHIPSKSLHNYFWNVRGAAGGFLTSPMARSNGEAIWRLYAKHSHCVALLTKEGDKLRVLAVCGRTKMKELEAHFYAQ